MELVETFEHNFGYYTFYTTSMDDNTILININPNDGDTTGKVYVYEKKLNNWEKTFEIVVGFYVESVQVNNNIIVVSYQNTGNNTKGNVNIYTKINNNWQLTCTLIGENDNDYFGYSVGIFNNFLVVGASGYDNDRGKVYIYKKNKNDWELKTSFLGESSSQFGSLVNINNNYLCVGSYAYDNNRGKIYIYELILGKWEKTFEKQGENVGDIYGNFFSLQNNYLTILAESVNGKKKLYIYEKNKKWELTFTYISDDNLGENGNISIYGNYMIFGDGENNKVKIFKKEYNTWNEKFTITKENLFGYNVNIYKNYFLIAEPDYNGDNIGKTYLYKL